MGVTSVLALVGFSVCVVMACRHFQKDGRYRGFQDGVHAVLRELESGKMFVEDGKVMLAESSNFKVYDTKTGEYVKVITSDMLED